VPDEVDFALSFFVLNFSAAALRAEARSALFGMLIGVRARNFAHVVEHLSAE
jgi:hypothetical protein